MMRQILPMLRQILPGQKTLNTAFLSARGPILSQTSHASRLICLFRNITIRESAEGQIHSSGQLLHMPSKRFDSVHISLKRHGYDRMSTLNIRRKNGAMKQQSKRFL